MYNKYIPDGRVLGLFLKRLNTFFCHKYTVCAPEITIQIVAVACQIKKKTIDFDLTDSTSMLLSN
jgi:hypothetical protein